MYPAVAKTMHKDWDSENTHQNTSFSVSSALCHVLHKRQHMYFCCEIWNLGTKRPKQPRIVSSYIVSLKFSRFEQIWRVKSRALLHMDLNMECVFGVCTAIPYWIKEVPTETRSPVAMTCVQQDRTSLHTVNLQFAVRILHFEMARNNETLSTKWQELGVFSHRRTVHPHSLFHGGRTDHIATLVQYAFIGQNMTVFSEDNTTVAQNIKDQPRFFFVMISFCVSKCPVCMGDAIPNARLFQLLIRLVFQNMLIACAYIPRQVSLPHHTLPETLLLNPPASVLDTVSESRETPEKWNLQCLQISFTLLLLF